LAWIKEFERISVTDKLLLELIPTQPNPDTTTQPVISGIEVLRTDAKEIKGGVAGR
jgi:hypothetical protein